MVCINVMTRVLKMPINYLRLNSVIPRKVPTKEKQRTEKQSLLKMTHQKHLSETTNKYKLTKERSQEDITLLMVF